MIIYYTETGEIYSISHMTNSEITYPYIETDDPVASEMFNGTTQIINYRVIEGALVLDKQLLPVPPEVVENYIYQIPTEAGEGPVDLHIVQVIAAKNVSIVVSQSAIDQYRAKNIANIILTACPPNDPYSPLWSTTIPITDTVVVHNVDYSGTDDIRFYTEKVLNHYYHEVV